MTEKELRKLGRAELLELLLEQAREFETLEQRLNAAEAALQSQQLQLETCGSIAEASLKLNGVFEAAQKAAEQYQQKSEFPGHGRRNHDDRRVFLFMESTFSGEKRDSTSESRTCGDGNGRVLEKKDRRSFRRTAAEGYAGTCAGRKTEDPDPG